MANRGVDKPLKCDILYDYEDIHIPIEVDDLNGIS